MISAIVAVDNNWGIGYNGELLEKIPEDMKYFKELTTNNVVVMGRKTWDSLPKKPLPNRTNIVITNQKKSEENGAKFMTLEDATRYAIVNRPTDVFIIGGGQIYKKLLPICSRVYVTKILKNHKDVDTYFPNLDKNPEWETSTCTELRFSEKDIPYAFLTYDRIS